MMTVKEEDMSGVFARHEEATKMGMGNGVLKKVAELEAELASSREGSSRRRRRRSKRDSRRTKKSSRSSRKKRRRRSRSSSSSSSSSSEESSTENESPVVTADPEQMSKLLMEERGSAQLSCVLDVSSEIRQRIYQKRMVDFGVLMNMRPGKKLRMDDWLSAWNKFATIHTTFYPEEAPFMSDYCERIRRAEKIGMPWQEYDLASRAKMSGLISEWWAFDLDLWYEFSTTMTTNKHRDDEIPSRERERLYSKDDGVRLQSQAFHASRERERTPKQSSRRDSYEQRSLEHKRRAEAFINNDPYQKGYCREFNFKKCSFGPGCKFKHFCGICGEGERHPEYIHRDERND